MSKWFDTFTTTAVKWLRHPVVFAGYVAALLVWFVWGFFVGFSEAWNATVVTPLTVLTFLYLPLILYSQDKQAATMIAYQKETAEDLADVNDRRAKARVKDEM